MNKRIEKFALKGVDGEVIRIPADWATVMKVGVQERWLYAWILLEDQSVPTRNQKAITFFLRQSGELLDDLPMYARYVDSIQVETDTPILHVWVLD